MTYCPALDEVTFQLSLRPCDFLNPVVAHASLLWYRRLSLDLANRIGTLRERQTLRCLPQKTPVQVSRFLSSHLSTIQVLLSRIHVEVFHNMNKIGIRLCVHMH